MHFFAGIHPSKTFPSNQDAFLRRKSSPQDISPKSGCISPPEIIPPRHFYQIRMNFSAGNHPSKSFPSNQDESRRRKTFRPQEASWQSCAPEAHVSVSANKPRSQLPPISPRSQLPPESSCLSFRQKNPASASARKLRIHLCLDSKHNSRELPDAVIVHAADGNRYGKCISRPAIQ